VLHRQRDIDARVAEEEWVLYIDARVAEGNMIVMPD
jgi:hypothetical protein